jgi:hypothetical protein
MKLSSIYDLRTNGPDPPSPLTVARLNGVGVSITALLQETLLASPPGDFSRDCLQGASA